MKIIGIEPALPNPHYLSNLHLVRVGLLGLLTHLKNKGHEVRHFADEAKNIETTEIVEEARNADIVAISTLSATHPRGESLARLIRRETGKPVVMGGPHVTFCKAEETLNCADYAIRFEGEFALPKLVEALEGKRAIEEVPNLVYRRADGSLAENPVDEELPDLNDFPFPDFSLVNGWKKSYIMPIETSRGCPHNCTFCCVHKMFPKVRFRNPRAVVEEIKKAAPKEVFFSDDNFAINMVRSKEILSLMLQMLDHPPRWSAQVRATVAKDEEWLRMAKRTNCQFLCIGFESVNPASLEEMHKRQTIEEVEGCLAALRRRKMISVVHGSFVVGLDSDDENTAGKTVDWARRQRIPSVQIWVLTPLPGTELKNMLDAQDRILSDWPGDYDGTKATFAPAKMPAHALQESVFAGMERFYSLPNRLSAALRGFKNTVNDYVAQLLSSKELWRVNFREAAVKWYGSRIVRSIKKRAKAHLFALKAQKQ